MENAEFFELKSPPPPLKISSKKPRNATFEIMRILAMIFIIAHHFRGHGGWIDVTGINSFFMDLEGALFVPSVNIFVMISAYFMCSKDDMKIHWKKIGNIWLTVFFYSIVLFAIFAGIGYYKFDVLTLISSLFPVASGKYWFVSAYLLMMVASPFLNAIVSRLNKAQYSVLFVAIILIAALQDVGTFMTIPLQGGYCGIWFCLLYLLTAYIRKFDVDLNKTCLIIGALVFVGIVALNTLLWKHPRYTSIVTVYMSLYIFLTTKKIKITNSKLSKVICFISSLTFGIYLIHDSNEMRGFMYENIFHSSQFIPSEYSFLIYSGFIALTFVACGIIEYIRQLGFNGAAKLANVIFGEKITALKDRFSDFICRVSDKINGVEKDDMLISG